MLTISNPKDFILPLLRADLRNYKLVSGLDHTGVVADDYYIDLSQIVFKLMGFTEEERDDNLYNFYYRLSDRLINIEAHEFKEKQNDLANEFYIELLNEKIRRQEEKIVS